MACSFSGVCVVSERLADLQVNRNDWSLRGLPRCQGHEICMMDDGSGDLRELGEGGFGKARTGRPAGRCHACVACGWECL